MSRIVLLGGSGMAGHMVRTYLSDRGHDISSVARSKSEAWDSLDVCNEPKLFEYLADRRPEIVVNCIGVLVKESEERPASAIRLNALLPNLLADKAGDFGYRLIHISSDCVFSGSSGLYEEGDFRDADEVYGRAKALGEIKNERDLTIRTSIIGPELHANGTGLFNWFMHQEGSIKGFVRIMWGGVSTLELAKFIHHAIQNRIFGLVHLTNGVPVSKFDLLCLLRDVFEIGNIEITKDIEKKTDRSLVSTRSDLGYAVPSYKIMIEELRDFMREHDGLYRQYA